MSVETYTSNTTNVWAPPATPETICLEHPTEPDLTLCGKYDPSPPREHPAVTCPDCLFLDAFGLRFDA